MNEGTEFPSDAADRDGEAADGPVRHREGDVGCQQGALDRGAKPGHQRYVFGDEPGGSFAEAGSEARGHGQCRL